LEPVNFNDFSFLRPVFKNYVENCFSRLVNQNSAILQDKRNRSTAKWYNQPKFHGFISKSAILSACDNFENVKPILQFLEKCDFNLGILTDFKGNFCID